MNKQERLATKAQAEAVRAYLATIGADISHVQALEVIARGQGMRSRHLLAPGTEKTSSPTATPHPVCTRVSYRYVDGSNCKRHSSTVFRGKLTMKQLQFIVDKLDDGLYFIPAQIGFENLVFAFDGPGDDHSWHTLEVPQDESEWVVDEQGYVLRAGDIELAAEPNAIEFATDADCDNLFLRFATLESWDETQQWWLGRHTVEDEAQDETMRDVELAGQMVSTDQAYRNFPGKLLRSAYNTLASDGFEIGDDPTTLAKRVGTNASQRVEFGTQGDSVVLRFNIFAESGKQLTSDAAWVLSGEETAFQQAMQALQEQRRAARFRPEAWDPQFE